MSAVDLDALAALEEERDFLLRSLDDLERERAAGDIDEADYLALRDDYTARAAAVLRAIDGDRAAVAAAAPPRRTSRTVLAAVVVLALAVGAGLAVAGSSGARRPGQVLTGGGPVAAPTDADGDRLLEAATKVREGDVLGALKEYDAVLAREPAHPAALTYKGWLLVNVGVDAGRDELTERGRDLLERATAAHPGYADAWFFYGFYLLRVEGDAERAKGAFQRALASDPVDELAREARRVLGELEGTDGAAAGGG